MALDHPWPDYLKDLGTILGKSYEYGYAIGQGKTGAAHVVRRLPGQVLFCLKALRPDIKTEARADAIDTLRKEAAILDPLNHRCIPRVFERDLKVPSHSTFAHSIRARHFMIFSGTAAA